MKLINNNLKIIEKYGYNKNDESFIVERLEGEVNKYILEVFDNNTYKYLIEDYIYYYKTYKNLSHEYLLKTIDFARVESINLKPVYGNLYYILTQYNDWNSLYKIKKVNKASDMAKIFVKLFTIIDFLHFSGFSYDYLTPDNIFISDKYEIKLSSIGSIIGYSYEKQKQINNYKYIHPELFNPHNKTDFQRDYYSLGILLEEFLLPTLSESEYEHKKHIDKMIENLKMNNSELRLSTLKVYAKSLSDIFMIHYKIDYKAERQKLNFDVNSIGIDSLINQTLDLDKLMKKGQSKVNGIIISGNPGTGKTKVLEDIHKRLELEGCNLFKIDIDKDNILKIEGLKSFIGQLLSALNMEYKFTPGTDTISLIEDESNRQYTLSNLDDKYSLLNRIAEGFINTSRMKPAYISIGNLNVANTEVFNDIDFIVSRIKNSNVMFLFTLDFNIIEDIDLKRIVNNWTSNGKFMDFKLKNLDEISTIKTIQAIVGSAYFPLEFSKIIYRESFGNPRYLGILIKHFFDTGEIFINNEGEWEVRTKDYDDIYFPQNFTETIRASFDTLSNQELELLKVMACFESYASEKIVLKTIDIRKTTFYSIVDKLIEKRVLYRIFNDKESKVFFVENELKRHIYNGISDIEKTKYHSKISEILLEDRKLGKTIDFNFLLKHLSGAGQLDVVYEIVQERISSEKIKNNDSVIVLLELLFSKLENKKHNKRVEVLEQLIECFILIGNYHSAEPYIEKLENISREFASNDKLIISRLYRFEIYARNNNFLGAKNLSKELRAIPQVRSNARYLLDYVRIQALFMQAIGKSSETIGFLKRAIDLAVNSNNKNLLGDLYNILGISYYFEGNHKRALEYYELAIKGFEYTTSDYNVVKPLSNIGSIYNEVFCLPGKALEYFKQCYRIAEDNNLLNSQSIFLNNIGEAYLNMADYDNSEIYFKKTIRLAKFNKDRSMEYLATINLGFTNISHEKLREAVQILITLRQMNKEDPIIDAEINMKYINFLGCFYIAVGDLYLGKKFSEASKEKSKDVSIIEYVKASSRVVYTESVIKMNIDRQNLEEHIELLKEQGNTLDSAYFILNLSYLSLRLGLKDIFSYLMEEFNHINNSDVAKVYKYDYDILNNLASENESLLIETFYLLKNKDIRLAVSNNRYNSHLGKKFYELKLYDFAIKVLLDSLDLFYKKTYHLGIDGYVEKLESYYSVDQTKALLFDVLKNGFGVDENNLKTIFQKNYYDLRFYLDLLTKDDLMRIYQDKDELNVYKNLTSLSLHFYSDYEKNINQLLKFISFHTLAENVTLRVSNPIDIGSISEYSYNKDNKETELNSVIWRAINEGEHILINKSDNNFQNPGYDVYVLEDQIGLIGVPILEPEKDSFIDEKRLINRKKEVYASLLLSTSSGINLFNEETLELVMSVSKLIYLNLENERLYRQSNYDKLTGVLTRSSIEKKLEELTKERVEITSNLAVMMLDIDRFKSVNDTYGHQAGDRVLSSIGSILKDSLRTTDFVGRYGGEEFILLLDNINKVDSVKVAKNILLSIENYEGFGIKEKVTVSIGISKFPEDSLLKEELIYKADQALYYAKEVMGRNQVAIWSSKMKEIENLKNYVHDFAYAGFANNANNVVSLIDMSLMNRQEHNIENRIFSYLGMLMDGTEAEIASLFFLKSKDLDRQYTRKNAVNTWIEDIDINNKLLRRAIKANESFTFIEWHPSSMDDKSTETFNIKSIILSPVLVNGRLKGIVYLEVPLKKKEFTSENIGFVETMSGVFGGNLY